MWYCSESGELGEAGTDRVNAVLSWGRGEGPKAEGSFCFCGLIPGKIRKSAFLEPSIDSEG